MGGEAFCPPRCFASAFGFGEWEAGCGFTQFALQSGEVGHTVPGQFRGGAGCGLRHFCQFLQGGFRRGDEGGAAGVD